MAISLLGPEVTLEITGNGMKDARWKQFGFQSTNPRTDFRGAGILGVRNLIYFARNYQEYVQEMIKTENKMFFMALNSISLSVNLTQLFIPHSPFLTQRIYL